MATAGDRIKEIRKEAKLNQTDFGKKLGVSRDVIGNLEYGRVELKEYMLKLICKTFYINEKWLLTGEGSKKCLQDKEDAELDMIFSDIVSGDNDTIKDIVLKLSQLNEEYLIALKNLIDVLSKDK